ncbi:unnamed protein product [Kuraishia capsulata CBS 1993]|uniref:Protein kinase domain-containing protein n=1 Tax=Kuraishia capsulata CBS 1993 TaxID=1382522 RepID=W6MWG7_9ASCO|nr:uncharacterized protein KUCA_T00003393001 [Kuraishia capsulata CBS 1993]CDK27415.1 unnamed protein product [Kuraishia capsulata CBS 1993]
MAFNLTPSRHGQPRVVDTISFKNRYTFKEVIGKGAFAIVYKAYDTVSKENIAVKQVELQDKESMESLTSEINLLTVLNHKNIVKYMGFDRTHTTLNILLEFCSGGSLRDMYIRRGCGLDEAEILRYTREMLEGLQYLHHQGIVHRDVKAANVLLHKSGSIKLADFGVSSRVEHLADSKTSGSPYWMAPEIIRLQGASTASDIWSVGATVVELATTVPPFGERPALAACHAIVTEDVPPIPDSLSNYGRDFVLQCFQKTPQLRYSAKRLLKHNWFRESKSKGSTAVLHKTVKPNLRFSDFAESDEEWDKDFEGLLDNKAFALKMASKGDKQKQAPVNDENIGINHPNDRDHLIGNSSPYKDHDEDQEDGFVGILDVSKLKITQKMDMARYPQQDNFASASQNSEFVDVDTGVSAKVGESQDDPFSSFDREISEPEVSPTNIEVQRQLRKIMIGDKSIAKRIRKLHHLIEKSLQEAMKGILQSPMAIIHLRAILEYPETQISPSTRLHLVYVLVAVFQQNQDELKKFCLVGGLPVMFSLYPNRAFTGLVVTFGKLLVGHSDLLKMLVSSNCLTYITRFFEEDISSPPQGPLVCIDLILELLESEYHYVRDYVANCVSASSIPSFFAVYLEFLDAKGNTEYVGKLIKMFSSLIQVNHQAKEALADEEVFTGIIWNVHKLSTDDQTKVIRLLNAYSTSPTAQLKMKSSPQCSNMLVKLLETFGDGHTGAVYSLLQLLYNYCHADADAIEDLLRGGITKGLQKVLKQDSVPCKESTIPLVCEIISTSSLARQEFIKTGLYVQVFAILIDPIYQINVLDALVIWIADTGVSSAIESRLVQEIYYLVEGLELPFISNYDINLEKVLTLLSYKDINVTLFRTQLTRHWFAMFREAKPAVQIALLKCLRALILAQLGEPRDELLVKEFKIEWNKLKGYTHDSVIVSQIIQSVAI